MSESEQGTFHMDGLCQHISDLTQAVQNLQEGYTRLEGRVLSLSSSAAQGPVQPSTYSPGTPSVMMLPPKPRVPTPERFSRECKKFRAFSNACELYFSLQPCTFSLETTKLGFVISLLQGEPQFWAHRLLEQRATALTDLVTCFNSMSKLYEDPQQTATAETALYTLQQGRRVAEDYVSEFKCWSADTNWNNAALCYQFRKGLSEPLKDELARVGDPLTLDALINLSIQIDRRLREESSERAAGLPVWK